MQTSINRLKESTQNIKYLNNTLLIQNKLFFNKESHLYLILVVFKLPKCLIFVLFLD